ncbi:MAG: hypothetical protein VYE68_06365 [Acidobacteriota bacterium]|nr:hypothetical protein [Acidobacteriota bacterium]
MNYLYCGSENIDGVDECTEWGQSLADTHLPDPVMGVERRLRADRVDVLSRKPPIAVSDVSSWPMPTARWVSSVSGMRS